MTNRKLGFISAIIAGMSTAIFAMPLLIDNMIVVSFGICKE